VTRIHRFGWALALLSAIVGGVTVAASAQTLPTPQIQSFVCQLVGWLQGFAPIILMLALAAGLFMALVAKKGSLVGDLVGAVIIALILINLGAIMGALGLSHC
jgi:uncharacterized membrane protein